MTEEKIKIKSHTGKEVEILGPTYEEGKPVAPDLWRKKLKTRQDMLKYLRTGERYWFSKDWFGSEKRKTPA
jgi:hypothetical protein